MCPTTHHSQRLVLCILEAQTVANQVHQADPVNSLSEYAEIIQVEAGRIKGTSVHILLQFERLRCSTHARFLPPANCGLL